MAKHIKPLLSIFTTGVVLHAFCTPSRFSCIEAIRVDKPEVDQEEYEDTEVDDNYEINYMENRIEDLETKQNFKRFLYSQNLPNIQQKPEELLIIFYNKLGNKIPTGIRKIKRGGRRHKSDRRTRDGRIRDGRIRLLKHQF